MYTFQFAIDSLEDCIKDEMQYVGLSAVDEEGMRYTEVSHIDEIQKAINWLKSYDSEASESSEVMDNCLKMVADINKIARRLA